MSHRDDPDTVGKIRLQIFSSSGQLSLLGLSLSVIDFTNLFLFWSCGALHRTSRCQLAAANQSTAAIFGRPMFTSTAGSFAQRLACVYVLLWSLFGFSSHFQDQESHRMLKARLYWVQHAFTTLCFAVLKFLQLKFGDCCDTFLANMHQAFRVLVIDGILATSFTHHFVDSILLFSRSSTWGWVVFLCFLRSRWGQQQDSCRRCFLAFVPRTPTRALSSKWPL